MVDDFRFLERVFVWIMMPFTDIVKMGVLKRRGMGWVTVWKGWVIPPLGRLSMRNLSDIQVEMSCRRVHIWIWISKLKFKLVM